jgi:hypothetical protein
MMWLIADIVAEVTADIVAEHDFILAGYERDPP